MYGKCTRYRVKGIPGVKDRSFDALQDAKTWLAQAQTDARRGEFVDPRDGAISLKDYIATHWWPTQSGDPSTIERIEQRVRRHWKKRLEKDLGPTSIRLVWATLSSVLQAAAEDRRLGRNPCRSSTVGPPAAAPGRVEAWSAERVLAIREALPDRYRLLLVIGAGLGLRQGEALGLSVDDIDFEKEVVHVRRQVKMVRAVFRAPQGTQGPGCAAAGQRGPGHPAAHGAVPAGAGHAALGRPDSGPDAGGGQAPAAEDLQPPGDGT
ncbi:site-specific integrase [Streptomyces seoulensis]|uniref:site-specific integrase n=1 Tax=Streptomyces seoulensis TaxID=73044 RepID=UPI003C2F1904